VSNTITKYDIVRVTCMNMIVNLEFVQFLFPSPGTAASIREILGQSEELLGVKEALDQKDALDEKTAEQKDSLVDQNQIDKNDVDKNQIDKNLIKREKKDIPVERTLGGLQIDPDVQKAKLVSGGRRSAGGFPTMDQFLRELR
jgi:hypothetical protein